MPRKRKRRLTIAAIVLPVVTLVVLKWLEFQTSQTAAIKSQLVEHTRHVESQIELLISTVKDLETGSRGYLLTEDTHYLEPYEAAKAVLSRQRAKLRSLVADNPLQTHSLADMDRLVAEKIRITGELVTLQRQGRRPEAMQLFFTGQCNRVMIALRSATTQMLEAEQRLLAAREHSLAATISSYRTFSLLVAVSTIVLLGVFAWLMLRLERLQGFLTICAWSKTVEYEGKWISIEQYLEKRFGIRTSHGISPKEFERFFAEEEAKGRPLTGRPEPGLDGHSG